MTMANIKKIHNPFFAGELRDYLEINGYHEAETIRSINTAYFLNNMVTIEVTGSTITVSVHCSDEVGVLSPAYLQQTSFTGLKNLDIFKFMLLMDLMGAIPLKQFAADAKRAAGDLYQSLGNMFRPLAAIK